MYVCMYICSDFDFVPYSYTECSKMPGQTSRVSSSHRNQESSSNVCPGMSGLLFQMKDYI
jgi:hypothetical protein